LKNKGKASSHNRAAAGAQLVDSGPMALALIGNAPTQLKAARHSLGLSAEAFARLIRVGSGRTVRRWEAGEREIRACAGFTEDPGARVRLLSSRRMGSRSVNTARLGPYAAARTARQGRSLAGRAEGSTGPPLSCAMAAPDRVSTELMQC
jgi:hypothetical protein